MLPPSFTLYEPNLDCEATKYPFIPLLDSQINQAFSKNPVMNSVLSSCAHGLLATLFRHFQLVFKYFLLIKYFKLNIFQGKSTIEMILASVMS